MPNDPPCEVRGRVPLANVGATAAGEACQAGERRLTVTRRSRAFSAVPSQPPAEVWVYQLARILQLAPTEIGLVLNIRRGHVHTGDLEVGNDLVILDRLDGASPKAVMPLNRSAIEPHPRTGQKILMSRYPLAGGFVPRGACRADGTPHPHAGTGFAMSHIIGFPVDAAGKVTVSGEWEIRNKYVACEVQQYRYDGTHFYVEHAEVVPFDALLAGWRFTSMPLGNFLADGDDLIGGLVGEAAGTAGPAASGFARWQRRDGRWRVASFQPMPGAEGSCEPSLVRDRDGSLLFAVRTGSPDGTAVVAWRSGDRGATWTRVLHAPHVRAETPVTLNRALDGTLYIAANPHRETNSLGQALPSWQIRDTLLLWPLSEDRRRLMEPVMVRDCNVDFGKPPHNSTWRVDHPVGLTVRLADGQWRHLLTYRVLEDAESLGGAPLTAYTGTYVEEVLTTGPTMPEWEFGDFDK